jgi:hypothetical protein
LEDIGYLFDTVSIAPEEKTFNSGSDSVAPSPARATVASPKALPTTSPVTTEKREMIELFIFKSKVINHYFSTLY